MRSLVLTLSVRAFVSYQHVLGTIRGRTRQFHSSRASAPIGEIVLEVLFLIRPAQPRILPRYGYVLIVSTEDNVRAIAVADFD
jgi:hypothetical protein